MPKLSELVAGGPTPEPTPEAMGGGLGERYTQYIGGPALDYLQNFMDQSLPGHPLNKVIPGMVVPETLTQAGLTAGTLLAPEAKAAQYFGSAARNSSRVGPMIDRMLGPVLGGAAGGFAEKGSAQDAIVGGALGTLTGLPAEAASAASRWFAGSKLAQRFFKEDPEAISGVVRRLVKEFPDISTPEQFGTAVWKGVAQDRASQLYDKRMTAIAEAAKARAPQAPMQASSFLQAEIPMIQRDMITSPRIRELQQQGVIKKGVTSVDDMMQQVRDLRLKGRTTGGDPKMTLDGRQARDFAKEIAADLKVALDGIDPKLGKQYVNTDVKYARFAEMLRYLKQPKIVNEDGQIDMKLLQQQMKEERAFGLSHSFTPKEFQSLMDAVFRGADDTVVDQIAKPPKDFMRLHANEAGRIGFYGNILSMFRNNKYAGNYDVEFLKPKGPALLLQRLGAGAFKGLNQPINPANTLAAPSEED